ncbi:unnamed protein product (macronuclear) [Paramecium tetraurelia]|uniref:PiggyBac transposable element-derived protein domain-containing protein n=1 Tax=Paramecium tetraurelia TaxID=5888 RepID=A0EGY9_PARTE|nr:uncharacterized protein GSPATT00026904001 [Paramecium tetraurelia]CAK94580.1 unnamed protein product [Paramecium tetraurelia]|eukprot:XP_001461953.1 hypothetical protein (macronuclear) [Paramecium tetraurelia strain d4-2]
MNSIIENQMEGAMSFLYKILIQNSEVQLSQNYNQIDNKYSTIIVFERYISDSRTIFLYAYSSNSLIIIKQHHYKLEEGKVDQYITSVEKFLKDVLEINQHQACICYVNYASVKELNNLKIKEEAQQWLQQTFPKSQIILVMEYQNIPQIPNTYLQIKIPKNTGALLTLLKIQRDLKEDLKAYEEFMIIQINQINETHQMFMSKLEQCEKQVVIFNFLDLIKPIIPREPPEQIEYLAQFLMNLPPSTQLDIDKMIAILKLYKQNLFSQNAIIQKKLNINEYLHLTQTELTIFQDIKNCHFPKKGNHSQKCKVCQKKSKKIKKSSFVCEACQIYYKINVALCAIRCFRQFHLNPEKYLRRKKRTIKIKVEE